MNIQNKIRMIWIDNLRAFAIILVVLGHNYFIFSGYISTFHVPIFFLISGYLFKYKKDFKQFFSRKCKTLLQPYFFFSITLYIFWVLIGNKLGGNAGQFSYIKGLIGIIYGVNKEYIFWQSGLWFVLCLFTINILYYFIFKYLKKLNIFFIVIICLVLGWGSTLLPIRLPWSLDVAFTALIFFILGNQLKKYDFDEYIYTNWSWIQKFVLLFVLLVVNCICYKVNGAVSFYNNKYGFYLIFLTGSISGTLFYFFLFRIVDFHSRIISLIGQDSLFILAYHGIAVQFIKFVQLYVLSIPIARNDFIFTPIVYCIIQLVICLFIAFVLRRTFKRLFI